MEQASIDIETNGPAEPCDQENEGEHPPCATKQFQSKDDQMIVINLEPSQIAADVEPHQINAQDNIDIPQEVIDKVTAQWKLIYFIFLFAGCGFLVPYHSFITAIDYFKGLFGDSIEYYITGKKMISTHE
jgi:hypothetical protein